MSIVISLVMIPTLAIFSFSQSNSTLPSDPPTTTPLSNASIPDELNDDTSIENDSSFASLSRSLAETNQTDEELLTGSDDERTPPPPPSTESDSEGETNEDIQ